MSKSVVEDLSIIVPTYNEKHNIPFLLFFIKEYLSQVDVKYEVVIVDDNSPDGTYDVVLKLKEVLKMDINLLKRHKKLGLGSSYVFALKHCKYKYVIIMDSDLSHHPKYIPNLIKKQRASKCEIVSCTRYNKQGGASNWPKRRVFISKLLNFLCKILFHSKFSDLTGSFRLYDKSVLDQALSSVHSKGFLFQVEIALRCEKLFGCKIDEVPIIFIERVYGSSKLDASEMARGLLGLFRLIWEF